MQIILSYISYPPLVLSIGDNGEVNFKIMQLHFFNVLVCFLKHINKIDVYPDR